MLRALLVAALACLSGLAFAQRKVQSEGFTYSVDKVPAWVQPAPKAAQAPWAGRSPARFPLVDLQINLMGREPVRFLRLRGVAVEPAALANIAEVHIDFNPAYQSVTLHEAGVTRDGRRFDRLKALKVRLLQRESQLERSVYDGVVTAFAVIDDVRVGDVVDISYSVRGANPVFDGKFSGSYILNWLYPADLSRVRIEYPSRRVLNHKVLGVPAPVQVTRSGKRSVLEVVLSGLPPVVPEDLTPAWASPFPELHVSEFADWAEVRRWAARHYDDRIEARAEVLRLAERLRSEGGTPEEMAARALAFVQEEIRYFAVSTGASSHRPHPPGETLERRYGDCKDKAVLLVALLQRLGIEARPALVSVERRRQLSEVLPAPTAFDHVVVHARMGGRAFWLDPTRTYQGRKLATLGFERFEKALLVGGGEDGLLDVQPLPGQGRALRVTERYTVRNYSAPAALRITAVHRGGQAEDMRAYLAARPADALQHELAEDVVRRFPGTRYARPVEVRDDREANELVVTEHYEIPRLFEYERGYAFTSFGASSMYLRGPENVKRSSPVALPYPMASVHRVEFEMPVEANFRSEQPVSIAAPHFSFAYRGGKERRLLAFEYRLESLRDHVPVRDVPRYLEGLSKAREYASRRIWVPVYDYERVEEEIRAAARQRDTELVGYPEWTRRDLLRAMAARLRSEAAIASGLLEGEDLARAWSEVAAGFIGAGEHGKALQVVDKALETRPENGDLRAARGKALAYSGRFDAALGDIERALAGGYEGDARFVRGQILHYLGRHDEAVDTLLDDAGRTAGAPQSYRLLWLYLAARKAKLDVKEVLRRAGYDGARSEWPGPLLGHLVGELSEPATFALAREDVREAAPRACEAWFFVGQRRLLEGDRSGAKLAFENALRERIIPYIEHAYAQVELERLR